MKINSFTVHLLIFRICTIRKRKWRMSRKKGRQKKLALIGRVHTIFILYFKQKPLIFLKEKNVSMASYSNYIFKFNIKFVTTTSKMIKVLINTKQTS